MDSKPKRRNKNAFLNLSGVVWARPHSLQLAVIKDYRDAFEGSGGSKPLKKAKGAAKRQSGHQKVLNFSASKVQEN